MIQELTGQPAPNAAPVVATLEQLRSAMAARASNNRENWRPYYHAGLGLTVMLGPMSSEGYFAVENVAQYGLPGTPVAGQKISSDEADAMNRDIAFMVHGVMEPRLSREDALALWRHPGCGAANRQMIAEIEKINPPRAVLITEFRAAVAASRMTLVFYRILREAGALTQLRDWLTGDGTDEERQKLAADLVRWQECITPFEALMEAEEAAKHFEIGVYDRLPKGE